MPRLQKVKLEKISEDEQYATYNVEAIHVTTTRNSRTYTKPELEFGGRSLSYRPININHDESRWLYFNPYSPESYPSNTIRVTKFNPEKNSVSGEVRLVKGPQQLYESRDGKVNATAEYLDVSNLVDTGKIKTVSIEQLPTDGENCSCSTECACEQLGIVFTGIALLETYKGVEPGDPQAKISKESTTQFACTECKELFNSKEGLAVHRGMKHAKPKEADAPQDAGTADTATTAPTDVPAGGVVDQAVTMVLSDMEQRMQDQIDLIAKLQADYVASPDNDALEDNLDQAKSSLAYLVMDYMRLKSGEKKEDSYPWDQCIADQIQQYGDMDTAQKVCGAIKAQYGSEGYKEAKAHFERDSAELVAHFMADGKSKGEAIKIYLQNKNAHKEKHEGCWQCKEHVREELLRAIERQMAKKV